MYKESLKMASKNNMLKKLITSLNMEINELKSHVNKKLENDDLNNRAKDLAS